MSNDRVQPGEFDARLPKPEVKIIVDGNEIIKPGMHTFFAEDEAGNAIIQAGGKSGTGVITYTVCTCNTVPVCTCDKVPSCSCNTYVKPSCSCNSHSYNNCSCNKVCTCVPVH